MSDYHILETKRDRARVVFHFPVPNENNFSGINLQLALKQYMAASTGAVTCVPWLQTENPTEYAAIVNGEVYEVVRSIEYNANESNLGKRSIIDSRWNSLSSVVADEIRERLQFWGMDRDVGG